MKKEFKKPSLKVMNVQTEALIMSSVVESKQSNVQLEGLQMASDSWYSSK